MTAVPTPSVLIPTTLTDNQGNSFLSYIADDLPPPFTVPLDLMDRGDVATFLSENISVSHRASTRFSVDLTTRDDLILTILSLLLLLVIEAIITTILLRTYKGTVSNFGFSVKQFIELARDFKFRYIIRGTPLPSGQPRRKINLRLLLTAIAVLIITFTVEATVLWLSTVEFTQVTNAMAAFNYEETLLPDWNLIRDNVASANNRPCVSLRIVSRTGGNLEQGNTRVTPCLVATGNLSAQLGFQPVSDEVNLTIQTINHLYGAEHRITIGDLSASYKMIIYFTMNDRKRKILSKRSYYVNYPEATYFIHRQYIAFLFNEYVRRTNDTRMNLDRLTALSQRYNITVEDGENVAVVQINGQRRFRQVTSSLTTTRVRGILPRGDAALEFAVAYFKGASGVSVGGPDLNDLDVGSSSTWPLEQRMWLEESRRLNWLTMTILLASAVALLHVLRILLRPIGTSDIARAFVSARVGAEFGRPIGIMARDEKRTFDLDFELSRESSEKLSDGASFYSDDENG